MAQWSKIDRRQNERDRNNEREEDKEVTGKVN